MEDSLASAGTARAAAETPDELLTRAAASGVIHGEAAASLTGLFYEARFSTHPHGAGRQGRGQAVAGCHLGRARGPARRRPPSQRASRGARPVTGPGTPAARERRRAADGGWQGCRPELAVGATLVLATSLFVYAYAGVGLAIFTVAGWAVASIAFLRALVPTAPEALTEQHSSQGQARSSFLGFWRKRAIMRDATASMISYDIELRPTLQHLLAARLAERHGVSLYADPEAARRIVLPAPREDVLWFWLDPRRPAQTDQGRSGIPPRTLAAILNRLERL